MASISQLTESWGRTLRHRMKTFIGARPSLFFPIFRRRSGFDELLVAKDTDICIEGFPRSANSFAVGAFERAQERSVHVAHHTHVPANPIRACRREIPTLVLIRDPLDVIVSGVALSKQVQVEEHGVDRPIQYVSFRDHLWAYLTFYRSLTPYRDRFLVAPFEAVIQDMGRVIARVNEQFGTAFNRFEHTQEAAAEIHASRGYHAGPSEQRRRFKRETRVAFDEQLQSDSGLHSRMNSAKSLFSDFVDAANGEGICSG